MAVRRPAADRPRARGGGVLGRGPLGSPRPAGGLIAEQAAAAVPAGALEHLRAADPVMGAVVERLGPLDLEARRRGRPADAYGALLRSIVGQQLSTKAARSIYERLLETFGGRAPTPQELLATDPEAVRGAGLSRPKVSYLRDLAERVADGELDLEALAERDDGEVSSELTCVKGIGQWSADMFLIFHLGRPDILPVGDLGIRRAAERLYGLPAAPAPDELTRIAEPWRPHRSLASLYLWASLDAEPA